MYCVCSVYVSQTKISILLIHENTCVVDHCFVVLLTYLPCPFNIHTAFFIGCRFLHALEENACSEEDPDEGKHVSCSAHLLSMHMILLVS